MPKPSKTYEDMSEAERASLDFDARTGLEVVARAACGGVEWLHYVDGTEVVRDVDGNPADWPG